MKGEISKTSWSGKAFLSSLSLNTDMNKMMEQFIRSKMTLFFKSYDFDQKGHLLEFTF